jgi:asparagine synthase (glutamine-hydrolysing)
VLPPDTREKVPEYWEDLAPLMENTDELGGFQFLELRSSLPDELLMFADKLSMAHSLEVRVPYLDREVVQYVESLPAHFKVRTGTQKWLHRHVCQDFLPKRILRRRKRGFATNVVDEWFRDSSSKKMEGFLLDTKSLMYQFLRPQTVQKILQDHISNKNDNYKILSSLVIFEQWLRLFA